jgi:hypothetical protein
MQDIIQIAGIIDREEAQLLLNAGVDWLGFPLRLPVHRYLNPKTSHHRGVDYLFETGARNS